MLLFCILYLHHAFGVPGQSQSPSPKPPSSGKLLTGLTPKQIFETFAPKTIVNTLTDGIVSGIRDIDGHTLIQHSAPISPGSSGGALIHENGYLLGVNTSQWRDSQNLNFAIPANLIPLALARAKAARQPIRLPVKVQKLTTDEPPAAFVAMVRRDYLRAIELAKDSLRSSDDTELLYCIIGAAYYRLDRFAEAETYLKQTISLPSAEPVTQSTARWYLLLIRYAEYKSQPNSSHRGALALAVREFLKFDKPTTLFTNQVGATNRAWAADVLLFLQDLEGQLIVKWIDHQNPLTYVGQRFTLTRTGDKQYSMVAVENQTSATGWFSTKLQGTLYETNGMLRGSLNHTAFYYGKSSSDGAIGEQDVQVNLSLSEDATILSGGMTSGPLRAAGLGTSVFQQMFRAGTAQFSLFR